MKHLLAVLVTISVAQALSNVTISKCCPMHMYMSHNTKYQCIPSPSTLPHWTKARVYTLTKFLPEGTIPANWHVRDNSTPDCGTATKLIQLPLRHGAAIPFINGSLMVLELGDGLIDPGRYCLDYEAVVFCEPAPRTRVKKCCGNGGVYSLCNKTCVAVSGGRGGGWNYESMEVGQGVQLVGGFPTCVGSGRIGGSGAMVIGGRFKGAQVHGNGSLTLAGSSAGTVLGPGAYCLEHVLEDETPGNNDISVVPISVFTCHELLPPAPPSVLKQPTTATGAADIRFTLYPIALVLGTVFLGATLAAGCLLPVSHHVLHWRCQTNHVACLLAGNVMLCVAQLSGDLRAQWHLCFLIAVMMHFLFLAAFFWLNTMCFNIWWTFRDLRPQSLEKSQERWRLRIYEVYAWGGPLLISTTAAILDIVENTEYSFLKPGFVQQSCWFVGRTEILTYFYGPIGVLLVINLILFGATARELTCGLWKRELVKSTTERAALGRVCMKLVVVMGVSWIADVFSWAIGGPAELWYITDLINCLQGVFIFIVVGLQPQVLAAVKRIWCLRKNRTTETVGATNHHSSSSQGLPSLGDTITNNSITTKSVPLETSC